MRFVVNLFVGLIGLVLIAAAGAYFWFWATPVGINNLINKQTIELILDSPETMSGLGMIDNSPLDFHSGKLDSYTKEQEEKSEAKLKKARAELDKYGPEKLKGQELLTWEIMAWFYDDQIRQSEFDHGFYRVNQISGVTVNTPQFLTDTHVIKNEKSVRRYISRVEEFGRVLKEVRARVEDDRAHGVVPPDFIIEKALSGMRAFIEGGADANPLVTTLPEKLKKIEGLSEEKQAAYLAETKAAVASDVIPGYEAMIALFEDMATIATHDAGVWRLPEGDKIYAASLKSFTTTDLTPDEIHEIGLAEVARIEGEMDAILKAQNLTQGTVAERVKTLMKDPQYLFPNTDEGRKQMIDYLVQLNKDVMAVADKYFITLPPQPLEILRIPEYAEEGSSGGYYNSPALDGSRPGRFYINQHDTADNPRWTLPTLLYHEAAPGHHFQLSAAQLVKNVPIFRTVFPFSAYAEGWGLYAERIAATDMGLYKDDSLGDLGRLQAEMFRSVRLVVDTGMHHKRWTREQAIEFMLAKTGNTEADVTREIERYVVWPGQACAYKTGQLAILRLRAEAETELGDKFDLRQFHETVLLNGGMPLGILEKNVRNWIAEAKAKA
jgi:uncharacterized protein (DUF885 family)